MGLTQDLIDAKIAGLKQSGATDDAISKAQVTLETQTELEVEAIVKFLTNVNFTITQLKAPIIVENVKIPPQPVNIELQTLIGDKAPILSAFEGIPGGAAVGGPLESSLEKAVTPLLEGGATAPALDVSKDDGGLDATGYVFIGEDPDSKELFDVEDEDGQRNFTTVKLFREDIESLL